MFNNKKTAVIIAAAGSGKRMGSGIPKQYLKMSGEPIISKTIKAFCQNDAVDYIFIVTNDEYIEYCKELKAANDFHKVVGIVPGGKERQDSVYAALKAIQSSRPEVEYILIHDAARPFVHQETIDGVIAAVSRNGAAVAAVPVKDSIRKQTKDSTKAIERDGLFAVQTPQGFKAKTIIDAYKKAFDRGYYTTDDAGLAEKTGVKVEIVLGTYDNIKITTKEDMPMENRIGTGYDVHQLVTGRKLILGGVEIPFEKGLLGHSDADVLLHALMDAMLGAASLGDIGKHFPDSEAEYKDISSIELLKKVSEFIQKEGYTVSNIDVTLIAQKPKIADHIKTMRANIADALKIELSQINIKGTTTETLGYIGRGEGIAAQAVCILNNSTI